MENIQEGLVVEINGVYARIKVLEHSSCKDCGVCSSSEITIEAYNPLQAQTGQKIKFIMPQNNALKSTFIVFFLPLISIFTGVFIGKFIAGKFHSNQVILMIIFGIISFLFTVSYIIYYDRKSKLNVENYAKIIEIIS